MSNSLDLRDWNLFPAIVVGFQLVGTAAHRFDAMPDLPEWCSLLYDHQVGGYGCYHQSVAGVVLRLADNRDFLRDPDRLRRGFAGLSGQSGKQPNVRDLKPLSFTRGDPYTADDLNRLSRFLSEGGLFPPLERGVEAMVEFKDVDPLRYFNGWRMYSAAQQRRDEAQGSGASGAKEWLPEWCFSQDQVDQVAVIYELLSEQLREESRWEYGSRDFALPGVYLVWMNSD